MSEAEKILEWTERLKTRISESGFHPDDIRSDYFGMQYDVVYNFYKSCLIFDLSVFLSKNKIAFSRDIGDFERHIQRIEETIQHKQLFDSYRNYVVRGLILGTWSNFELCVTTFCEAVTNSDEKIRLYRHQVSDVMKCLKNSHISEQDTQALNELLSKDNLAHVPIVRKTDVLFKKATDYGRDKNRDKAFLVFFGKLRNTMHTNFIYYGRDNQFQFRECLFQFKNGELVRWSDPYLNLSDLYLALVDELTNIWTELCNSVQYDSFIPYPAEGQT